MTEPDRFVRFEMLVDVARDRSRTGATLTEWLRIGMDAFGGDLAMAAWRRAPLPEGAARDEVPYGRPGEPWVDLLLTSGRGPDRSRMRPLSAGNWQAFLAEAGRLPDHATVRMRSLDEQGRPFAYPAFDVSGSVKTPDALQDFVGEPVEGSWLQMLAGVPLDWLANESYLNQVTRAWLELAQRCDPCFGEIGVGQGEMSELELHLPGPFGIARRNIPSARRRLRGYGWLTICPRELGDQLGGEAYFNSSGAFARVVPLNAGGYWLQATPGYATFDMAAAERVFRALAPVLIPGQPTAGLPHWPQSRLVAEHPRPDELAEPAKPERGYTKGPATDRTALPTFTLVAGGEVINILGSTDWRWELLRDGVVCHSWDHNKPDGDRYTKILAELVIARDVGRPVAEWTADHSDDGSSRYRAILGEH